MLDIRYITKLIILKKGIDLQAHTEKMREGIKYQKEIKRAHLLT